MMLPVTGAEFLYEKVRRLEQDLEAALALLRALSERMRHALGAEAVGPELSRFLAAFDYSEQRDLVARLDALAADGAEPEAVRLIRDLTGLTWDQAFAVFRSWAHYSLAEKERWVRSAQMRKALHAGAQKG